MSGGDSVRDREDLVRCLVVALAMTVSAPAARAASWEAIPASSRIVVHVYKKGIFSAFAHDHAFEVTRWRATADLGGGDPASAAVEVVLSASSLHDTQRKLSASDRRKVDAQAAGPEVLDAEHHPQIVFRSQRVELEPAGDDRRAHARGTLHGTLTLRGQSVPAAVHFEGNSGPDAWHIHGRARVKQSELGIKPFSGFGGTVGVKDELEIELELLLRPKVG
jgi:polyisoprenoid-binding protein YceI